MPRSQIQYDQQPANPMMTAAPATLLGPEDPPVYTMHTGESAIVFTGPHNGWHVPKTLYKNGLKLGIEDFWFDPAHANRRHEACDWGMKELFDALNAKAPHITTVASNYSRLVVDKNRTAQHMVTPCSSETDAPLSGNQNVCPFEVTKRLEEIYAPYHARVDALIQETKKRLGKILYLDLHSFTPTWNGVPRPVGVGTLTMFHDDFSKCVEDALAAQYGDLFRADEPYDLSIHPFRHTNAGAEISGRNGIPYVGIEFRSDLLATPEQVDDVADKLLKAIAAIESRTGL